MKKDAFNSRRMNHAGNRGHRAKVKIKKGGFPVFAESRPTGSTKILDDRPKFWSDPKDDLMGEGG
jgi:hypothetical protein